MRPERKLYLWPDIEETPDETGVYAWYYRHTLSDFDINKLVTDLKALAPNSAKDASARVVDFLQSHLFGIFVEEPYDALLRGPLKPTYQGKLINSPNISKDLVERIMAEPTRLWTLKKVLEEAVPEFASPIYIGMSVRLNVRLRRHKRLIERYKAAAGRPLDEDPVNAQDRNDHSFAREVVRRGFSTNGLVVSVRVIDASESVHVDAENILNRINYPLCGRN